MTSTPPGEEALLARIYRTGLMEVATGGLATGLDHVLAGAHGVDATGLNGANATDGSVLHHGPASGGETLERPSAGYLAHASAAEGVSLERTGDLSNIARSLDAAGTFDVGGLEIDVMDYLPGGDVLQLAGGNADPGQIMMRLAQHGIQAERHRGGAEGASRSTVGGADAETSSRFVAIGARDGRGMSRTNEAGARDAGEHPSAGDVAPDADVDARDRERLAAKHRLDLDTAVETSDAARVHTELHAHGRVIEVDTDFEARLPDNREEREEAAEHADHLAHAPSDVVSHEQPGMRMRSVIAAHMDAQARDEGISM